MLNSLDALIVAFFGMSFVSILGVILMLLTKNEKWKKGIFYGLGIWGMVIAFFNVQTHFSYMTGGIAMAVALGALAAAGLLVQKFGKNKNRFKVAQMLVAVSVVVGMFDLFAM